MSLESPVAEDGSNGRGLGRDAGVVTPGVVVGTPTRPGRPRLVAGSVPSFCTARLSSTGYTEIHHGPGPRRGTTFATVAGTCVSVGKVGETNGSLHEPRRPRVTATPLAVPTLSVTIARTEGGRVQVVVASAPVTTEETVRRRPTAAAGERDGGSPRTSGSVTGQAREGSEVPTLRGPGEGRLPEESKSRGV